MQEYGFYIKRDRTPEQPESPQSHVITDLPHKEPPKQPKDLPSDLPSPRHRPGEPILYEPPADSGRDRIPMVDPTYSPLSGMSMNDPMELK